MSQPHNIERLLERYVNDDLSESDRDLVEQYLTGNSEDAAQGREDLRFERALKGALQISEFDDDVAGNVLDRVFRRATQRSRRVYADRLAGNVIDRARADGKLAVAARPSLLRRPGGLMRIAASIMVVSVGLWWAFEDHLDSFLVGSRSDEADRTVADSTENDSRRENDLPEVVATVSYVKSSDPFRRIPKPGAAETRDLHLGADLETDELEQALVNLTGGARLAMYPGSRVRLRRDRAGAPIVIQLDQGGLRFEVAKKGRPILVRTSSGQHGRLTGQGEVVLASSSLGRTRASLVPSLHQIVLVRIGGIGRATFRSTSGKIRVGIGETAIVGPATAVKVSDAKSESFEIFKRPWRLSTVVSDPEKSALVIRGRSLSREVVAREAMRVYAFELAELVSRSLVVQWELERLGIRLTEAERADAAAFVRGNEFMQVTPLRSSEAGSERSLQIAGTLAIKGQKSKKRPLPAKLAILATCESIWQELAQHLRIERPIDAPEVAFRISFRNKTVDISRAEAWASLRRFMRANEMEEVITNLSKRELLAAWLRSNKRPWPQVGFVPTIARAAQAMIARMSGMTLTQFQDEQIFTRLLLTQEPVPPAEAVQQYLGTNLARPRQLIFQDFFFPFADPDHGIPLGASEREAALQQAREATARLRQQLADPSRDQMPIERPIMERGSLDPQMSALGSHRLIGGPRSWWKQIYGRDFNVMVRNMKVGEVSDPILGPEGYHVVNMIRAEGGTVDANVASRIRFAQVLLQSEIARARLEALVDQETTFRVDAAELLE